MSLHILQFQNLWPSLIQSVNSLTFELFGIKLCSFYITVDYDSKT